MKHVRLLVLLRIVQNITWVEIKEHDVYTPKILFWLSNAKYSDIDYYLLLYIVTRYYLLYDYYCYYYYPLGDFKVFHQKYHYHDQISCSLTYCCVNVVIILKTHTNENSLLTFAWQTTSNDRFLRMLDDIFKQFCGRKFDDPVQV